MKKITSSGLIEFAVSSNNKLDITPEGVLITDAEALIVAERLGSNVTITDMEPDEIEAPPVEEATPIVAPPEDAPLPTPEPVPADVVAPAEPSAPSEAAA
jgi:hypothetical protein